MCCYLACVAYVLAIDTTEILATNDVATSVCRTRVARSLWKRVSRSSSTSSVKGNLGGQAWLTWVQCLVRRGLEEYNSARGAMRASMVNTGPISFEASLPRCCGYSLWGNVPWKFMVME